MEEEERDVYLNQLTAEERSKNIKLTEKHCRQMMDLIYKKKMEYFKSGGEDWKEVLDRSYPRDPPNIGQFSHQLYIVRKMHVHQFKMYKQVGVRT